MLLHPMNNVSLLDRVEAYREAFPNWPPPAVNGEWLYGIWVLGNDYRNKASLYGTFPPNFLKRVYALYPEYDPAKTLHLFSGALSWHGEPGLTIDIQPERRPALIADVQCLPFADQSRSGLIIADPPYSAADAVKYGTPMVNRRKVFSEVARIARPGTHMVWLDTVLPQFRKAEWKLYGTIGIVRSTNHRVRLVSLFERR